MGFKEKSNCIKDSVYIDDGFTGTTLARPALQRMLARAGSGFISCIIVKDFSRFARDYITLGSYLEHTFPLLGIRFISIHDHYDSADGPGQTPGLAVQFQNLLYDLYSRDLSQKVRASLAARKEKGGYISANCPFGYAKAADDRHRLCVEEDEAAVVKRIFELADRGLTPAQTAQLLQEEHVPTPAQFRIKKGKLDRQPKGSCFAWSPSYICQVLSNPVYAGDIVYGKYEKDAQSGKVRLKPRGEWKLHYNCHEPLIQREQFERINQKRARRAAQEKTPAEQAAARTRHPLAGKLACGHCGYGLRYRRCKNPCFYCYRNHCTGDINAMYLEHYVLFHIYNKEISGTCTGPGLQEMLRNAARYQIRRIVVFHEQKIEIEWENNFQ